MLPRLQSGQRGNCVAKDVICTLGSLCCQISSSSADVCTLLLCSCCYKSKWLRSDCLACLTINVLPVAESRAGRGLDNLHINWFNKVEKRTRATFINLRFRQQELLKGGIQQSCKNSVSAGADVFAEWTVRFAFLAVRWEFPPPHPPINAASFEARFPLCPPVFSCLRKLLEAN